MCGIGGIINQELSPDQLTAICSGMASKLSHRGPDDFGVEFDLLSGLGLVHTRLSIIDLSAAGHQPMSTEDERYTIVFNGEIYNFRELRQELEGQGDSFRSNSDTEVILKMFRRYGPNCAQRFIGMFAFGIWDSLEKSLLLARGPLGIKPLYYWCVGKTLAFASELRAVLTADLGPKVVSKDAMYSFFRTGSVEEPSTLIQDVEMLPPGCSLTWKNGKMECRNYWNIRFPKQEHTNRDSVITTRKALEDSIQRHLVSDVPVGVFLSGGIDSTAILALMKSAGIKDIHTFSLSFNEISFDEGAIAARTAKHFGTTHHEWKVGAKEAQSLLPEFANAIDQPSIDGFNVYCVSKFASDHGLKVVLSGLGGDELFGSYPSFVTVPKLLALYQYFDARAPIRNFFGQILSTVIPNERLKRVGCFLKSTGSTANAYGTVRAAFSAKNARKLVSWYLDKEYVPESIEKPNQHAQKFATLADEISYLELTRYMLNQLLRDADVMSMAFGLELRVPFVDSGLIDTIGRIPAAIRLQSGKQLLLDAVPEIPEWVAKRPKRGFTLPFDRWVNQQWRAEFSRIESCSPVPLNSWYRKWSLFAFEHFMLKSGIDFPDPMRRRVSALSKVS